MHDSDSHIRYGSGIFWPAIPVHKLQLGCKDRICSYRHVPHKSSQSFFVDRNSWDPESTTRDEVGCSYSALSLTIPLQVGYHVIDRPPYRMSIFTGPRLRFVPSKYYSVEYTNTDPYVYSDSPASLVSGWTAGMSIQIGRTFLDFEYEATINNVSYGMYETTGNPSAPDFTLNRRVSMISFSYGIIF